MSNIVALFDAVLNSFLQSFAPIVDQHFHEFDIQISSRKYSKEELDSFLEKAFILFPRKESSYIDILEKLTSFASSNSTFIIGHLCSKLTNEISRKADSLPSLQIITLLTYKGTNYHHFMFLHYLILIILSDLLLKIISKFPSAQSSDKIVKFGYSLCIQNSKLRFLQNLIIDTWSYIFYYVSLNNLECIIKNFNVKFDQENTNQTFKLIHRISGNQTMADLILQSFIQLKRRKILNSELLLDLSVLLSRINCNVETLSEFFKIIWEAKGIDELKFGSIIMISALFNRIPSQAKKILQFYQTRVFKHAQNDKKVERSAKSFLILIRGDISKIQGPSYDTNPLSYISATRPPFFSSPSSSSSSPSSQKQKNQSNSESFIMTFMKVFFPKSNFSICPNLFRDILIQLASIDINEFTTFLLPKFLSLNHNDYRLIVILDVIPYLNREEFIEKSFCHATIQQISAINQSIKKIIFEMIPVLQTSGKEQPKVINSSSIQIQSIIDEADHFVNDFFQRNNFTLFDYNHNDRKFEKNSGYTSQDSLSLALNILNCIKITFSNSDFLQNPELINTIIELSCSIDQPTSEIAASICYDNMNAPEIQPLFIKETLKSISGTESNEIRSKSIQFLSYSLLHLKYKITDEDETNLYELEAASLICLMSSSSFCRSLALNLFKQIISLKPNSEVILHHMVELNDSIIEKVKHFMMVLNVPEKPFITLPLIGHISLETACHCKYNDLWIINYSEILNIIIDLKLSAVLKFINENLQNRFDSIRKTAKQKKKSKKQNNNETDNNDGCADFSLVSFFLCYIDTFASGVEFNEKSSDSSWYIEKVDTICKKVLKCNSMTIKRSLIKSFRFLNWRVIPTVLHSAINADTNLYSDLSEELSLIIQNPTNVSKIFSQVFHILIPYLNTFQTYFKDIQINGMSEIKWNEALFKKLKKNEAICINYCILISVAFKKSKRQISENEWPLSYRQVHVRFLTNWGQLSSDFGFEKLKAYSVNALIPILKSGTIFTNGFEFNLSMLDMLVQFDLADYSVLDSLLFFHSDILLSVFIKQVLLEDQRESQIFLNSIVTTLKKLDDSVDIQQCGGSLVLLAIFCYSEQMNDQAWRFILQRIAVLLLNEREDSDTVQMIDKAENISFVSDVFQFLTEQFIQFSFDVIKVSQKLVVIKMIVNFLKPWIEKLRILPTQGFIIPGIPTKFRIFSVLTFFNEILSLSQSLNNEQLDIFSNVWYNLLKSSDNNVIVLLLLFEYEKNDIKQKIFEKLLDKDPKMITKFLIKRCSFAFWYFIKTQRRSNLSFQSWMLKVLARSFIDYKKEATKKFVLAFHYSLLFIEKAGELFNALIEVLNLEPVDSCYVWTSDTDIENSMGATTIIFNSINKIKETNPRAIEKWSLEATRWAVACNDLRIAHRSLIILNCLEYPLDTSFTRLLSSSVLYFLNHASLIGPLTYLSNMTTTENENEIEDDNFIDNVTFDLNLDENHQFSSSSSSKIAKSLPDPKLSNSSFSSSLMIHVTSSNSDSYNSYNSENDEISCYFSHNETIDEENIVPSIDDVSYYVSECFKLLNRHFEEPDIPVFAFKFASCFVHYRPFLRNCLGNALPLFMSCYSYPLLRQTIDKRIIIDAFIPFSRSLENSRKSQETFVDIIIKIKSPELYLVASIFLTKSDGQFNLPSIDIGMSYEQIMSKKYSQEEIQSALAIFAEILKNCSKQLSNSIFIVANEILLKYGKVIDKSSFVPIYASALSLIAIFESAYQFVQTVSQIAPSIMSLKSNEWPPSAVSIDDVKSSISEIIKDMNKNKRKKEKLKKRSGTIRNINNNAIKLSSTIKSPISSSKTVIKPPLQKIPLTRSSSKSSLKSSSTRFSAGDVFKNKSGLIGLPFKNDERDEIVPITKCKEIKHLFGLIDQKTPPKIIPFASHYEMIIGLTKEVKKKMKLKMKEEKILSSRNRTSSFSLTSPYLSNKSMVLAMAMQDRSSSKLNLTRLNKMKIRDMELDLPDDDEDNRDKFIVPFSEFLKISEENSSEMSNSSMMGKRKKKKRSLDGL